MKTSSQFSPSAFAASTPPTLRISGPSDLLVAIPYLLGFHPRSSLVLVGLCEQELVVTVRMDLPEVQLVDRLTKTVQAMARGGSRCLIAAAFTEPDDDLLQPDRHAALLDVLRTAAGPAGCAVTDLLTVRDGRWRSSGCAQRNCCEPAGHRFEPEVSEVAVAATVAGMVARPSRESLAQALEPGPEGERERLSPLLRAAEGVTARAISTGEAPRRDRSVKRALFSCARQSASPGWRPPEDDVAARFGVALRDMAMRDAAWMAVDDGRLDGRPLWQNLARGLPRPYDAAPLFLFAWATWRAGDGALAGIAAERTIDSDPTYSAADLLLAILAHGADPRRFPRLHRSADRPASRGGDQ